MTRADILFFSILGLAALLQWFDVIPQAVVVAVVVVGMIEKLDTAGRPRLSRTLVTIFVPAMLVATAAFVPWNDVPDLNKAIYIFFGLFPLVNAVFDTLSYAATLALVRIGMRSSFWPALTFGILDLVIAGVLFLGLGATLIVCLAGLNAVAGTPIVDIGGLLARIGDGPSADTAWAYLMVFSTLLPTLLHFALTFLSLERFMLFGQNARFARLIRAGQSRGLEKLLAPIVGGIAVTLPFLFLYALWFVVWHFGSDALSAVGQNYMSCLLNIAIWIEAI